MFVLTVTKLAKMLDMTSLSIEVPRIKFYQKELKFSALTVLTIEIHRLVAEFSKETTKRCIKVYRN